MVARLLVFVNWYEATFAYTVKEKRRRFAHVLSHPLHDCFLSNSHLTALYKDKVVRMSI